MLCPPPVRVFLEGFVRACVLVHMPVACIHAINHGCFTGFSSASPVLVLLGKGQAVCPSWAVCGCGHAPGTGYHRLDGHWIVRHKQDRVGCCLGIGAIRSNIRTHARACVHTRAHTHTHNPTDYTAHNVQHTRHTEIPTYTHTHREVLTEMRGYTQGSGFSVGLAARVRMASDPACARFGGHTVRCAHTVRKVGCFPPPVAMGPRVLTSAPYSRASTPGIFFFSLMLATSSRVLNSAPHAVLN